MIGVGYPHFQAIALLVSQQSTARDLSEVGRAGCLGDVIKAAFLP